MPAEVQTGTAVLYGITNDGTQIAMPGYATFILDGVNGAHNFELDAIKDENKADKALVATNENIELEITWTPSGTTRAAAAATVVFLTPLASVIMNHFKVAAFNTTFIYIGSGKINLSQGPAKLGIKLRKYADATQNASLATTVSG
jgi:hypothetical protein